MKWHISKNRNQKQDKELTGLSRHNEFVNEDLLDIYRDVLTKPRSCLLDVGTARYINNTAENTVQDHIQQVLMGLEKPLLGDSDTPLRGDAAPAGPPAPDVAPVEGAPSSSRSAAPPVDPNVIFLAVHGGHTTFVGSIGIHLAGTGGPARLKVINDHLIRLGASSLAVADLVRGTSRDPKASGQLADRYITQEQLRPLLQVRFATGRRSSWNVQAACWMNFGFHPGSRL